MAVEWVVNENKVVHERARDGNYYLSRTERRRLGTVYADDLADATKAAAKLFGRRTGLSVQSAVSWRLSEEEARALRLRDEKKFHQR